MNDTDTGGPAFPGQIKLNDTGSPSLSFDPGMTLLDWFAGQALAGFVANSNALPKTVTKTTFAEGSYNMAEAMIEERKKRGIK